MSKKYKLTRPTPEQYIAQWNFEDRTRCKDCHKNMELDYQRCEDCVVKQEYIAKILNTKAYITFHGKKDLDKLYNYIKEHK